MAMLREFPYKSALFWVGNIMNPVNGWMSFKQILDVKKKKVEGSAPTMVIIGS